MRVKLELPHPMNEQYQEYGHYKIPKPGDCVLEKDLNTYIVKDKDFYCFPHIVLTPVPPKLHPLSLFNYGWMAKDCDGDWYWFEEKPVLNCEEGIWYRKDEQDDEVFEMYIPRERFLEYYEKLKGVHYKNSLVRCGVLS